MTWLRICDGFAFHPKRMAAGNEAVGAWVAAGSWSSANLTDGYLPPTICALIAPPEVWARLRSVGLTEAPSDGRPGEQIHDWLEYNPSAAKVRAEREAAKKRMAKGAALNKSERQNEVLTNREETSGEVRAKFGRSSPSPIPIPIPKHDVVVPRVEILDGGSGAALGYLPPPAPVVLGGAEGWMEGLAADLEAQGHAFGKNVMDRIRKGYGPTQGQRAKLREIAEGQRVREAPANAAAGAEAERAASEAQAVLDVYAAALAKHLGATPVILHRERDAARRMLPELRQLAARSAERAGGTWTPSPAEVLAHYLPAYFAQGGLPQAKGWPLSLLLGSVDPSDLPKPPRSQRVRQAPPPIQFAPRELRREREQHAASLAEGAGKLEPFVASLGAGSGDRAQNIGSGSLSDAVAYSENCRACGALRLSADACHRCKAPPSGSDDPDSPEAIAAATAELRGLAGGAT